MRQWGMSSPLIYRAIDQRQEAFDALKAAWLAMDLKPRIRTNIALSHWQRRQSCVDQSSGVIHSFWRKRTPGCQGLWPEFAPPGAGQTALRGPSHPHPLAEPARSQYLSWHRPLLGDCLRPLGCCLQTIARSS